MRSFQVASVIALMSALAAVTLKLLQGDEDFTFFEKDAMFTSFSFFCSTLIVFRTSQAYLRFWDGTTQVFSMMGVWADAASTVIAFTRHSQASEDNIQTFQQTLVRLISLLSAMILAELEGSEPGEAVHMKHFELVDVECLNPEAILYLKNCQQKPAVVFQWIQNLIVDNIGTGVLTIPAPLLSRTFQDLGSAMINYHDALKYVEVPFPFPYTACTDILLIIHWAVTPVVLCTWTSQPVWAALFTFILVFVVWSLHLIAGELENPFGCDVNDLHMVELQRCINTSLIILVTNTSRLTPRLCMDHRTAAARLENKVERFSICKSFTEVVEQTHRNSLRSEASSEELLASAPASLKCTPEVSVSVDQFLELEGGSESHGDDVFRGAPGRPTKSQISRCSDPVRDDHPADASLEASVFSTHPSWWPRSPRDCLELRGPTMRSEKAEPMRSIEEVG